MNSNMNIIRILITNRLNKKLPLLYKQNKISVVAMFGMNYDGMNDVNYSTKTTCRNVRLVGYNRETFSSVFRYRCST